MKTYRAAIIGAGVIAKVHAKTLHENARTELVAIADIAEDRVRELAAAYGAAPYTDYRVMIRERAPDIVIITLPHHLHKEAAIACASLGCHVLLEKPMALNAAECADIIEASVTHNVMMAIGHMQHYYPANQKAKEIVRSGRLGQLVAIHDRRHHPYFLPERPAWFLEKSLSGGGIVINIGSHSIDKIQWLTGSPVRQVKANLTFYGDRGNVEGSGILFMQTSTGVTATVSLCGYRNITANETELLFTGGQLKIAGNKLWVSGSEREYEEILLDEPGEPFQAQWNDVLNVMDKGTGYVESAVYGQTVCAVVDAAYRSHESGAEELVAQLADSPAGAAR
ncbi:Gfo/Idh/MocA family oxidoreductase [Paenibacillus sp. GYB004]|uniref:Gfo/Idh/MocA family protein n=1 Tax=Paenibacillus sp. GYB004 TaxID=2994393 RepID=UPI002F967AF0